MWKFIRVSLLFLLLVSLLSTAFAEQIRGYDKSQGGYQYAYFGSYPYEADGTKAKIKWKVLSVENDTVLLLSDQVLDTQQVIFVTDEKDIKNYNYRKINTYAESDLCTWMNDTMLNTLMENDPLRGAIIKTENGYIYPLTYDDYLNLSYGFNKSVWDHNNKPRQSKATDYCVKQRGVYVYKDTGNATYWAATLKSPNGYKMQIVGYDGHLSWGVYSRKNIGIRPALKVDLTKCEITGSGTKDEPFEFTYIGENAPEDTLDDEQAEEIHTKEEPAEPAEQTESNEDQNSDIDDLDTEEDNETEKQETDNQTENTEGNAEKNEENKSADETANQAQSAYDPNSLCLSFIGDLSIGDATQSRKNAWSLTSMVSENGYAWPFSRVAKYLLEDDLTFGNLEVTFTTQEKLKSSKRYNMIAPPEHVNILLEGGVDVLNTVNNHCMDFQISGYKDTLQTLDDAGLFHFGTVYPGQAKGSDIVTMVEVKGVNIGMIGFSYPQDSDVNRITTRIESLREQGCNLVVVSLHWGRETHLVSENWQYAYAKKVIDAGADIIWGHHPHVVQPIMVYKGKPILFSTGNFIFGTISDVDPSTGIFQINYKLNENGEPVLDNLHVIPCQTTRKNDYRPYELEDPAERQKCLKKLINKKKIKDMTNPPASFAETGYMYFDENGQVIE